MAAFASLYGSFAASAVIFLSLFIFGRYNGKFDLTTFQSLMKGENLWIFTLIICILTVIITFVFRRWVDRKSFISLGLKFEGHGQESIAGGMLAVFIICGASLLLKATGHLKWVEIIFDPRTLFLAFGSTVLVAFYEELIFRGYILNNLMDSFPKWLSLLISCFIIYVLSLDNTGVFSSREYVYYGFDTRVKLYIYPKSLVLDMFSYWMDFHGRSCSWIFR